MGRKLIYMTIVMCIMAALLIGCGLSADPTDSAPTDSADNTTKDSTNDVSKGEVDSTIVSEFPDQDWSRPDLEFFAKADTPIDMTMFINDAGAIVDNWGKDAYSRWLMEMTGVNLTVEKAASSDEQKLNLMIASNDLPDFTYIPNAASSALGTLMKEGYLFELDELIDKYAPKFKELSLYENNHKYYRWEQGGKLYYIPMNAYDRGLIDNTDTIILSGSGCYIRQDLWEEMGSPELDTLEKVESALYQVKDTYPEITCPLVLWHVYSVNDIDSGINMYYRANGGGHKYIKKDDGTLVSQVRDPIYIDTLVKINKLIKDGIINMADFADETNSIKGQEAVNESGELFLSMGPGWRIINGHNSIQKINSDWKYWGIDFFAAESVGHFFNPHYNLDGGGGLVIPKTTSDPERAILFYECLATDETQANANKGIKGVHWEYAGPTNRWIVAINEFADLVQKDYPAWQDVTGGNRYRWVGTVYYDSACARGDAMNDPVRKRIFELEATVDDFSEFASIDPPATDEESILWNKIVDLWKSYLGKVVLASDENEARALWIEFLTKADQAGLPQVEAYWTKKYNELAELEGRK